MSITITTEEDFKKYEEELSATVETLLKIKTIRYKKWEECSEIDAWFLEKDHITPTFKSSMDKFRLPQLQAYLLLKLNNAANAPIRFALFKRFQDALVDMQATLKGKLDPEAELPTYMTMGGLTRKQAFHLIYFSTLYSSVKGMILMDGYTGDPSKDFFGQDFYKTGTRGNDTLRQAARVLTHFGHDEYTKCNVDSKYQNKLIRCGIEFQNKKVPLFNGAVQFVAAQIPFFSRKGLIAQFLTEKVIAHACFNTLTDSWAIGGRKSLTLADKKKLTKFTPVLFDACIAALGGCEDFWFPGVRKDKMTGYLSATTRLFVETINPLLKSNSFKALSKVEILVYTLQLKSMIRAYDRYHLLLLEKPKLNVVGDSVTAGFGLDADSHRQSFMRQLVRELQKHFPCESEINAIPGAETATGLAMLSSIYDSQKWSSRKVTHVFSMLGGNNLINGKAVNEIEADIHKMLQDHYINEVQHVTLGFGVPASFKDLPITPRDPAYRTLQITDYLNDYYGLGYQMKENTAIIESGLEQYGRSIGIVRKMKMSVIVLDPHALNPAEDMQDDRIHPNLKGQRKLLEAAIPTVVEAIRPFFETRIKVFHEERRLEEVPRSVPCVTYQFESMTPRRGRKPPELSRESVLTQTHIQIFTYEDYDKAASREHKSPPREKEKAITPYKTLIDGLEAITAILSPQLPSSQQSWGNPQPISKASSRPSAKANTRRK